MANGGNGGTNNRGRFNNFDTSEVLYPIIALVVLISVLLGILALIFVRLREANTFLPENNLPIALVIGTVSLLVSVGAITIVFGRLGLTSWNQPLGLPQGSVRAIIALLLILLFFISAVFLYADSARPRSRLLEGVTSERVDAVATEDILSLKPNDSNPDLFDLSLVAPRNPASDDLAKQIVTTVSTLVVAIAAFYFGAKSVEIAHRPQADRQDEDEEDAERS